MAKVVIRKFKVAKTGTPNAVERTRVRDVATGRFQTVRTINAHSSTLSQDLDYVFKKNVEKARRDNKAVTGVLDRVPGQG